MIVPGMPVEMQEVPLEALADPTARLSWFVDGRLLGTGTADDRLYWTPTVGRHEVVVHDQAGATARVRFDVALRR